MDEWEDDRLGTYLSFRNGKTSPERDEAGYFPVFGSNGMIGKANDTNADEHAIIIGRVGTYCGSLHFSKDRCWVTDNAIICSAPVEEARFWFYALSSLDLNNYRAGSGQPLLNQSILKQIAFLVPPDHERIEIGKLLGALDDKIELNRRTNETLEALARAIFNDWFVDFGPTRAKAEGRPPYLAQELWDLFPDALDDDDKPEGWEYQKLQTLADVNWGDTKTTKKSYTEEGYTAFSASGPDGLLPYHDFERVGVVLSAIGANCGVTWLARGKWSCIKNTIRFWSTLGTRLAPPVRKAHIGLGVRSRASAEEVRADLCVVGG